MLSVDSCRLSGIKEFEWTEYLSFRKSQSGNRLQDPANVSDLGFFIFIFILFEFECELISVATDIRGISLLLVYFSLPE